MLTQANDPDGGTVVLTREKLDASAAIERLDDLLDLSDVRMKLADSEEGPGLDRGQIDLMEQEYRRFLAMQLMHPGAVIVPCQIVDEMWHHHILDTAAYCEDCASIFGRFLDHYLYFGMRNETEAQELLDAYTDTLDLYRDAFGEPPTGSWIVDDGDAARCRRQCAPMKCR